MCPDGWYDLGAWARNLLVALSTVVLNTWLALKIARRERNRGPLG